MVSDSSSQYNECWQSTSTVDSRRQGEEEEEEGEGEGGEEGEREREERRTEERVDGATGQSTIAKLVYCVSDTHEALLPSNYMSHDPVIYS